MNKRNFSVVIGAIADAAPYVIMSVSLMVLVASLIAFVLADVFAGQIIGNHVSNDQLFGLLISLAMTGFSAATVALLYSSVEKDWGGLVFLALLIMFIVIQGADSYMDSLSVDISRFGQVIAVNSVLSPPEAKAHIIYRVMVGAISTIGEPVGIGSIIMFPMIKAYVLKSIGGLGSYKTRPSKPNRPKHHFPKHNRPYSPRSNRPQPGQMSKESLGGIGFSDGFHPSRPLDRPFFIGEEENE